MVTHDTGRAIGPAMTPESLRGTPAGIASRAAANIIDFTVTSGLLIGIYIGFAGFRFLRNPRSFTFPAPSLALVILIGSAVAGLYFAACWAMSGRTYGALIFGLRVVGRDGHHPHVAVALLRAAACVVFPIGLVWAGVDRRARSAQDILLRTAVVYDWPSP
jgi:uncharacterized RDD family membrane protein YckC